MAAFNTSFLVGYVLLDSVYAPSNYPQHGPRSYGQPMVLDRLRGGSPARKVFPPPFKLGGADSARERSVPVEASPPLGLLGAINLNGLALFLVVCPPSL